MHKGNQFRERASEREREKERKKKRDVVVVTKLNLSGLARSRANESLMVLSDCSFQVMYLLPLQMIQLSVRLFVRAAVYVNRMEAFYRY